MIFKMNISSLFDEKHRHDGTEAIFDDASLRNRCLTKEAIIEYFAL
jgi:hypothetical protein